MIPSGNLPTITSPVTIDGGGVIELRGNSTQSPFAVSNGSALLTIEAGDTTIKGLTINNSSGHGIWIKENGDNTIQNNNIGTDVTGEDTTYGNIGSGIYIKSSNTNTITKNIISGNGGGGLGDGIGIDNSFNNQIIQNYIGTNIDSTKILGNLANGIYITQGGNNAIKDNVISANSDDGIDIRNSSENIIHKNYIGTDINGMIDLGNGERGIHIEGNKNKIGGENHETEGNIIAYNQGLNKAGGVVITSGTGNRILGNSIYANKGLGIDLGGDGVTENDFGDGDSGANTLQNWVLGTFVEEIEENETTKKVIQGYLNSTPNSNFRIEFFNISNNSSKFVDYIQVNTDTNGNAEYQFETDLPVGTYVEATVTNLGNNSTSEFSPPQIIIEDTYISVPEGKDLSVTLNLKVRLSQPSKETITVKYSTLDGTANSNNNSVDGIDYQSKNDIEITFLPGETHQEIELKILGDEPVNPIGDKQHNNFEIFARDMAYRQYQKGEDEGKDIDQNLSYGDLGYRINEIFSNSLGFYAIGLTSDEIFFSIVTDSDNSGYLQFNPTEGDRLLQELEDVLGNKEDDIYKNAEQKVNQLNANQTPWTFATVQIYDEGKEPVLAIRGTEFSVVNPEDIFDDANPNGVGFGQYEIAKDKLNQWLDKVSKPEEHEPDLNFRSHIIGHSLGGALTQWTASNYKGELGEVVTFNPPGISETGANNYSKNAEKVTHYITIADFVSMAVRFYGDEILCV